MWGWLAWGIAVLVAIVVLGFCSYEINWKARRVRRDLDGLTPLTRDLVRLQSRLATTAARAQSLRDARE